MITVLGTSEVDLEIVVMLGVVDEENTNALVFDCKMLEDFNVVEIAVKPFLSVELIVLLVVWFPGEKVI